MIDVNEKFTLPLPELRSTRFDTIGSVAVLGTTEVDVPTLHLQPGLAYDVQNNRLEVAQPSHSKAADELPSSILWVPQSYDRLDYHDIRSRTAVNVVNTRMQMLRASGLAAAKVLLKGIEIRHPRAMTVSLVADSEQGRVSIEGLSMPGIADLLTKTGVIYFRRSKAYLWQLPDPIYRTNEGTIAQRVRRGPDIQGKISYGETHLKKPKFSLINSAAETSDRQPAAEKWELIIL